MPRLMLNRKTQHSIAKERIITLFQEAEVAFPLNKDRANRYIELARKIAMKVKLKIPLHLKRRFCKYCYKYLQPGINARIRTRSGKVVIMCKECKNFTRIPLKK